MHDLGDDGVFCEKTANIPVLDGGSFESYSWNTGEVERFIDADQEGDYILEFIDENGCIGTDSIHFDKQCPTAIFMANIFTPDGFDNPENETFGVNAEDIISFTLYIYDRWGNEVFQTSSLEELWDGKRNNKSLEQGNYPWVLTYEGFREDGSTFQDTKMGTVHLVRG